MVELQPSKLNTWVRSPSPAPNFKGLEAHVAQLVEHALGKGEVSSSNLLMGSIVSPACGKAREFNVVFTVFIYIASFGD